MDEAGRLGVEQAADLQRAMPPGQEHVPWSLTTLILVIARLCEPSSELHIAEHFYRQSALCDLLGVPLDRVDDNRLYRGLDQVLPHKQALEVFLKERFGQLFGIEYDLLLDDVTSTYFEEPRWASGFALACNSPDVCTRPICSAKIREPALAAQTLTSIDGEVGLPGVAPVLSKRPKVRVETASLA